MLLILIAVVWFALVLVLVAVCGMAALADELLQVKLATSAPAVSHPVDGANHR